MACPRTSEFSEMDVFQEKEGCLVWDAVLHTWHPPGVQSSGTNLVHGSRCQAAPHTCKGADRTQGGGPHWSLGCGSLVFCTWSPHPSLLPSLGMGLMFSELTTDLLTPPGAAGHPPHIHHFCSVSSVWSDRVPLQALLPPATRVELPPLGDQGPPNKDPH